MQTTHPAKVDKLATDLVLDRHHALAMLDEIRTLDRRRPSVPCSDARLAEST